MDYLTQAQETKIELDHVSGSFCLAKWFQTSLFLQNGHTQSCHHVRSHRIPRWSLWLEPSRLHNTPYKKRMRKQMLRGQRPSECQYCWNVEDVHRLSDRSFKSSEPWARPHLPEAVRANFSKNINPRYVEVAFENTCNFKCSYCSVQSSSLWQKEIEQFGAYPGGYQNMLWYRWGQRLPIEPGRHNPYVAAFWKWWPDLKGDLHTLRITGGEPLLSQHTWRLLDDLIATPQPNLDLSLNSNMGIAPHLVTKLAEKVRQLEGKVKRFTLYTSIDTIGPQAEYIRHGLKYDLFCRNVDAYLTQTSPWARLSYMITVNALSLFGLRDLLQTIAQQRMTYPERSIGMDTPYLRNPQFLSVQILPPKMTSYLDECLDFMHKAPQFQRHEVIRLERIKAWMLEGQRAPQWQAQQRRKFCEFFVEHDRRRNTQILTHFPQLVEFWKMCQN